MILYKYLSFEGGCAVLDSMALGFSPPRYFNDPFELSHIIPIDLLDPKTMAELMDFSGHDGIRKELVSNYGVLSMTRSSTNSLMWAHYADSHKGFVVGIDTSKTSLESASVNVIPIQCGAVVYTNTRPDYGLTGEALFDRGEPDQHKIHLSLQQAFLNKPMCWHYEEEMRAVRYIDNLSFWPGDFKNISPHCIEDGRFESIVMVTDRPLFLVKIASAAVREVIIGLKNPLSQQYKHALLRRFSTLQADTHFFRTEIDEKTWQLKLKAI